MVCSDLQQLFHKTMKFPTWIIPAAAAVMFAATIRADDAPTPQLAPGDAVTTEAFATMQWIQGEPLANWEPGKVYLLECWATWCGPCIAMIPHVNHLHKTYTDRGLRVIALSVWEDDLEKTSKFVEEKGEEMSYPVAFVGRGGDFENDWLKPAGVRGIPHAFIVHDGKLVARGHPSRFTDEIIERLLAGEIEAAAADLEAAEAKQAAQSAAMREFMQAKAAGDINAMAKSLDAIREFENREERLQPFEIDLALARGDWPRFNTLLDNLPEDPRMSVHRALSGIHTADDAPVETVARIVSLAEAHLGGGRSSYNEHQILASLLWRLDRREDAIASLEKAVDAADDPRLLQAAPFVPLVLNRILDAARNGEMPETNTIREWYAQAARANRDAAAPEKPADD
jgi:thiol-disulfide isomerase/thioredoxin